MSDVHVRCRAGASLLPDNMGLRPLLYFVGILIHGHAEFDAGGEHDGCHWFVGGSTRICLAGCRSLVQVKDEA